MKKFLPACIFIASALLPLSTFAAPEADDSMPVADTAVTDVMPSDVTPSMPSEVTNDPSTALPGTIMLDDTSSSQSGALGSVFMIIQLAAYLFYSYCVFLIAKKLGEEHAWLAFVPLLSFVLNLKMAKMSLWWILGLFVPFLNIYVIIRALHQGISVRTGHGGWWTVGLIFLGVIMMPITAFGFKPEETAA